MGSKGDLPSVRVRKRPQVSFMGSRSDMTRLKVSMRKPPTPRGDEDEKAAPAGYYRSSPVFGHFFPKGFVSGALRTEALDFARSRTVAIGRTDTTSAAAAPGAAGRACGSKFRTRSDMLRSRKLERATAFLGSSEAMSCAVEKKFAHLTDRFSAPEYTEDYDLNGDGVVDPYEVFVCQLVDTNGDGTLDEAEREKLQKMLDDGDLAGLSFLQDRNGAGAKRALTWWNSAEEQRRTRRRHASAEAERTKLKSHQSKVKDHHEGKSGVSSKLLEAMGMPVESLERAKNSVGFRHGDAEGAFTTDSTLGPERRTMIGRHEPGLGYRHHPSFRSRSALMEWRRVEKQPTSVGIDLAGKDMDIRPEEALARHYARLEKRGELRESDKEMAGIIMAAAADTLGTLGEREAGTGSARRRTRAPALPSKAVAEKGALSASARKGAVRRRPPRPRPLPARLPPLSPHGSHRKPASAAPTGRREAVGREKRPASASTLADSLRASRAGAGPRGLGDWI